MRSTFRAFIQLVVQNIHGWQGAVVSLIKVMEPRFRGDIRFRGAAYVQGERVEITHVTDDRLYGVVHDGDEFQTQLSRDETQVVPFCTCAKAGQQEIHCKHVWATILIAEDQGYINGSVRAGHFPPFVAMDDDVDLDLDSDLFDDISIGEAYAPTQQKTRAARTIEKPLNEWERRLKTIRDDLDEGELASATSREREILYQLDIAASREHGLSYSQFVHGLSKAGVGLDRKVLAEIAVEDPRAFEALATTAKSALG